LASEQTIQQEIRIACSQGPVRLFRNNTGTLRDANGRPVQFGLCKGSADLIGWKRVTVTPEMVGSIVAVFTSIEVKTRNRQAAALSSSNGLMQSRRLAALQAWQGVSRMRNAL
jgi:hypothetical protein